MSCIDTFTSIDAARSVLEGLIKGPSNHRIVMLLSDMTINWTDRSTLEDGRSAKVSILVSQEIIDRPRCQTAIAFLRYPVCSLYGTRCGTEIIPTQLVHEYLKNENLTVHIIFTSNTRRRTSVSPLYDGCQK
jgi:hypothetical protein